MAQALEAASTAVLPVSGIVQKFASPEYHAMLLPEALRKAMVNKLPLHIHKTCKFGRVCLCTVVLV